MEQRILTCIGCPLGCLVTVELENGEVVSVTGNTCKRGDDYVRKEVTMPTRIVTSTVKVTGGNAPTVSVKTKSDKYFYKNGNSRIGTTLYNHTKERFSYDTTKERYGNHKG